MRRRVAITGIGAVTPAGRSACALWQSVVQGCSAVRRLTRFDASSFRSQIGAELDGFDLHDYVQPRHASRLDRFSQLALAAAIEAVTDAGLSSDALGPEAAVYLGSALGGIAFAEEQHVRYLAQGIRSVAPGLALSVFAGAAPTNVSIELGLHGPSMSNANSCASGAIAMGEAFRQIRDGRLDIALAGGVEAPLAPLTYGSFALIKAMSGRNEDPCTACRPFDETRDGFVMGEGAAVLVLEEWRAAVARGSAIKGELLGYSTTSDAHHMTAPLPDGSEAARAIAQALEDAQLEAVDVDYIQAHATGTTLGDAAEAAAIRLAFGEPTPPVSGTKAVHGHALGASPAIEAVITVLAMQHHFLPATLNLNAPAPECRLNHVPKGGVRCSARVAVSNAFGFGGINAALVFGAVDSPETTGAGMPMAPEQE